MSRIGKLPVTIPQGVEVNINDNNVITVKGKLGELKQAVDPAITVKVKREKLYCNAPAKVKIINQNMAFTAL